MAQVVNPLDQASTYRDSQSRLDAQKTQELLDRSSTLYVCFVVRPVKYIAELLDTLKQVGNLSFYTTEEQIYDLFQKCASPEDGGGVKTPCGFCFVEYYTHAEATAAVRYISGTKLDERIVRCDLDLGYREGRQYGRGKSGGQVCRQHELRQDYDAGRGGWGAQAQRERREVVYEHQTSTAGGGGEWKHANDNPYKRQREDDDEMEPNPQRMRENDDVDTRSGES
ncbi:RNA recognition motif domain-containing protein [Rhizoctonia solani AG-1 IA]|uniref:Nuclear cap-binding protein subunit 2 n=1 Tax=Thanatephorus cucumeris (strain AG1-IA) TaxID=983506 RepID=L8X658_THACA|nr:RNA recognition motif domain-containing protein [Rhizoctonia solani AG-1 IA]